MHGSMDLVSTKSNIRISRIHYQKIVNIEFRRSIIIFNLLNHYRLLFNNGSTKKRILLKIVKMAF